MLSYQAVDRGPLRERGLKTMCTGQREGKKGPGRVQRTTGRAVMPTTAV